MNKRMLITIGVAASVLAISMVATAPGASLRKLIKKEVAKQLATKTGPAGSPGAAGAPGAQGTALGFARVEIGGDVTEAQTSPGITDDDVSFSLNNGNAYCFTGLPFTPKNVQVTEEFSGAGNTITRALASIGDTGNCPGSSDQVTVFFTDTNAVGVGQQTAFHILFN